jgi:hypothetical protein
MRLVSTALLIAISLCLGGASYAREEASRQAWFYLDNTSQRWCSVATEGAARAASNDDRYAGPETGWLRYHNGVIDSIMVMTQSEDAYQEDTYTFAADLSVKQVVRKGHYVNDPFLTVTFRSNAHRRLLMTAESKRRVKNWRHETYFQDWPLYTSLQKMPFARLIHVKPKIAVTGTCSSH